MNTFLVRNAVTSETSFCFPLQSRQPKPARKPKGIVAIFQAKRTKNILKNRFLLSEKRVNMNAEATGDQASTESALTPSPELYTRVVIDAADQDLCYKVHSCG